MKPLSFEQMSEVEGGYSLLCKGALGLAALAYGSGSYFLYLLFLSIALRVCNGGGGDSTFG